MTVRGVQRCIYSGTEYNRQNYLNLPFSKAFLNALELIANKSKARVRVTVEWMYKVTNLVFGLWLIVSLSERLEVLWFGVDINLQCRWLTKEATLTQIRLFKSIIVSPRLSQTILQWEIQKSTICKNFLLSCKLKDFHQTLELLTLELIMIVSSFRFAVPATFLPLVFLFERYLSISAR